MTTQASTVRARAAKIGTPAWPVGWGAVLLDIVLSRAVFAGAYVMAWVFRQQGLITAHDHDLPGWRTLWAGAVTGATNFGDYDWYRSVAVWGYSRVPAESAAQQNWAFFPLQALANRLFQTPAQQFAAGLAVFAAGALLLYAYLKRVRGAEEARLATALLCWFPFSFTVSEFRPETFLFLFSMLALVLAARGQRWDASLAAGVAGLAKPNAFLLGLLLLPHAGKPAPLREWRPSLSGAVMVAACASGLVFMSLWLWRATGDPLAWVHIQKTWGAGPDQPWRQAMALFPHPQIVGRDGWDPLLLDWAAFAAAVIGIAALARARQWIFALYLALYVGLTFMNFGVYVLGKHLATCFPLFVAWAMLLRNRPALAQGAVTLSASLLAINGVFAGLGLYYVRA